MSKEKTLRSKYLPDSSFREDEITNKLLEAENHANESIPGYTVETNSLKGGENLKTEGSTIPSQPANAVNEGQSQIHPHNASQVTSFSAFPEEQHYGNQSNLNCDLYTKPLIDEIKFSCQKVIKKSVYLLQNEDKISRALFKIAFEGRDKFDRMIKDTNKIINKSKFMAFSSWIPQLMDTIFQNLEEHTERLQQDKKFDQKLNKIFNILEMGIPSKNLSIGQKLDKVLQEVLDIKANQVILKKRYKINLKNLSKNFEKKMESHHTTTLTKELENIKLEANEKNTRLFDQIANMENLIARIDHERRAYRDRNELLESENESLTSELKRFKKISVELDKTLQKTEIMKEQYFNISMMQMAECESLRLRY